MKTENLKCSWDVKKDGVAVSQCGVVITRIEHTSVDKTTHRLRFCPFCGNPIEFLFEAIDFNTERREGK